MKSTTPKSKQYNIPLTSWVSIRQLIFLASGELFGILFLNLLVRQSITDTRVELIQIPTRPPLKLFPLHFISIIPFESRYNIMFDILSCLLCTSKGRCPKSRRLGSAPLFSGYFIFLYFHPHHIVSKFGKAACKLPTSIGKTRIAADFTKKIVLGLAMTRKVEYARERVKVHHKVDHLLII